MSAESTVTAVRAPDARIGGLLHRDYLGFTQAASISERWLATPTPSATVVGCGVRAAGDGVGPAAAPRVAG